MSAKYLGKYFDIHCGGEDHITVHHTNEIAQTEACYGTRLANFWLHGYFLQFGEEKMSKSAGGFLRVQSLVEKGYDPLDFRYFNLSALYRAKINFTWEAMDSAHTSLQRLRNNVYEWGAAGQVDAEHVAKFEEAINDDMNMPKALAVAWEVAKSDLPAAVRKATILKFDEVLGLDLVHWQPKEEAAPAEILALLEQRKQARAEKRWADADAVRKQIADLGYEVEDTPPVVPR